MLCWFQNDWVKTANRSCIFCESAGAVASKMTISGRAICEIWSTFICRAVRREDGSFSDASVMACDALEMTVLSFFPGLSWRGRGGLQPPAWGRRGWYPCSDRTSLRGWKVPPEKNYLTCLAEWLSGQILLSIKWAESIVPPSLASSHVYVPAAIIELNRAASRPSPCNRAAVINSWPLVRPYFTFLPLQVSAAAGLAESSETSPRAG